MTLQPNDILYIKISQPITNYVRPYREVLMDGRTNSEKNIDGYINQAPKCGLEKIILRKVNITENQTSGNWLLELDRKHIWLSK